MVGDEIKHWDSRQDVRENEKPQYIAYDMTECIWNSEKFSKLCQPLLVQGINSS